MAMRWMLVLGLAVALGCDGGADGDGAEGSEHMSGKADELGDAIGDEDATGADPYAAARDVNLHRVEFDESLEPEAYNPAWVDTGFYLSGTEFWQKWSGGKNPTYIYNEGSDYGKRCIFAAARRFEAIMSDPPESLVKLREESNWGGSFFNWNDDYSHESGWGDGSSARLWAWRTSLVKWISQTNKDGSCYLPTLEMVEALAADCLETAAQDDGEIQGCRAP